ncbi:MAG: FMN-binding protein [Oscillospiraceae bacterium]|nr:FMN-binding protein [Oscillospiraceae bacterium]
MNKKRFSFKFDSDEKIKFSLSEKKKNIIYSVLTLFIVAIVSAALLSGVNELMQADERNKNDADMLEVMKRILSADEYRKTENGFEKTKEILAVYEAYEGEEIKGYCVQVEVKDYTDTITLMVAIDNEVKVQAVEIVAMSENAGKGIKAKDPQFLDAFKGKDNYITANKGTPKDKNQISVISGATTTSKAVTEGVNDAIAVVSQIKADVASVEKETGEDAPETNEIPTETAPQEVAPETQTPTEGNVGEGGSAQ